MFTDLALVYRSEEFKAIEKFYGDGKATRSGVPLINHIKEGLEILADNNASINAMEAFCIHPLLQDDILLETYYKQAVDSFNSLSILLAMEYRRAANAYLCKPSTDGWTFVEVEEAVGRLLPEVRAMLLADKLQNQKDFLAYHKGSHPRSNQLDRYFKIWLEYLANYGY